MGAGKVATWIGIGTGVGAVAILAAPFLGAGAIVGLPTTVTLWTIGAVGTAMGVGGVTGGAVAGASAVTYDLMLSNFRGKIVQILGPSQVGKNSLHDVLIGEEGKPSPTTESTNSLYGNNSKTKLKILENEDDVPLGFFKDIYELSGESVENWKERIKETNPHGIIYIVNSTTEWREHPSENTRFQKEIDGLKAITDTLQKLKQQGIDIRIKSFLILVNKVDLLIKPDGRKLQDKDEISNEYIKKLQHHSTNIYESLQQAVGEKTPIIVDYFCTDRVLRNNEDYLQHNIKVIKKFWRRIV